MKRLGISALVLLGMISNTYAAAPQQRRGGNTSTAGTQTQPAATSARSAVSARSATRTSAPAAGATTTARSATAGRTTVARGGTQSGTTTTAARSATVAARAGATQKVIGTGTKVATAAKNIVVSEACQQKYDGCMDSFCMLDNASGGRCICSDRNSELDSILAEIEKLDQRSYQMATVGVERIEMGNDADQAIANANAVAQSLLDSAQEEKKSTRRKLDLSLWDTQVDFDDEESIFSDDTVNAIEGKEGDALHRAASELCVAQMPECSAEHSMLQMMYSQRIKSDCTAYENSLKQQKNSSQQKLLAAEKALRDAALDQLRTANKYDLGQCTVEFKKCMSTTGGCGDDFKGCVGIAAAENAKKGAGARSSMKMYDIKGSTTKISIAASSYDALESKKPLCMNITNSCVAVKDQVWDTFLREVAPQIKTAELLAESDLRTSCISNISQCFQKACKDTMDPNDPDGSYDMCLSRPETVRSLCKVQIDPCVAAEPLILDYVYARLSAMRVDSCTNEVKECLQSDDRCGADYTQCIGLDTDTIIRMCPYDKLVGCQKVYGETDIRGEAVYDELANMVQGIMLGIDNNFLNQCQNAANEAMIKVCGSTEDCNGLAVDENIGARSLDYKICEYKSSGESLDISYAGCRTDVSQIQDTELGRVVGSTQSGLGPITPFAGVLDGTIYWESVEVNDDGRLSSVDEYLTKIDTPNNMSAASKEKIRSELAVLQKNVDTAIQAIEADPTVQFCMTGREVQGMKSGDTRRKIGERSADAARFPELTKQMRTIIATSALKIAKDNYYKKYDELNEKMLKDYATIGERMAEIAGENALDARREIARVACINFADASALPKSPNPPGNAFGKILSVVAIAGAAVAIPFTGGLSTFAIAGIGSISTAGIAAAAAGATIAGIGLASSGGGKANGADGGIQRELIGSKSLNQWNYKETITSTFEWDTLNCHKCVRAQNCNKKGNPLFGSKYCKAWADPVETCTDTQF